MSSPASTVSTAAARHGVPFWILWGIFGAESTWGKNGSNMFGLLSAAEGVDTTSIPASADQAAKTLEGLFHEHGDWEGAVRAYSGGDYGLDHVRQLAGESGVRAGSAPPGSSKRNTKRTAPSDGASGPMVFLITGALVLGGIALIGLGTMRAVGSRGGGGEAAA